MAYRKTVDMRSIVTAAVALLLALALQFLSRAVPRIGAGWALYQLPILVAGFAAGPLWGGLAGALYPLVNGLIFSSSGGIDLLREVALCGGLAVAAAYFYRYLPKKTFPLYLSLLCAQFFGRLAWGAAQFFLCLFFSSVTNFHWSQITAATVSGFTNGILLQILLVPPIVIGLQRARWISR